MSRMIQKTRIIRRDLSLAKCKMCKSFVSLVGLLQRHQLNGTFIYQMTKIIQMNRPRSKKHRKTTFFGDQKKDCAKEVVACDKNDHEEDDRDDGSDEVKKTA